MQPSTTLLYDRLTAEDLFMFSYDLSCHRSSGFSLRTGIEPLDAIQYRLKKTKTVPNSVLYGISQSARTAQVYRPLTRNLEGVKPLHKRPPAYVLR